MMQPRLECVCLYCKLATTEHSQSIGTLRVHMRSCRAKLSHAMLLQRWPAETRIACCLVSTLLVLDLRQAKGHTLRQVVDIQ